MDETIKSNILSTQTRLSQVLDQISELPSFKSNTSTTTSITSSSSSATTTSSFSSSTSVSTTSTSLSSQQRAASQYVDRVFSDHISLLKEYNQIKDVAMGMLSILAEKQGRRLAEVMDDHGLTEDD
ncbi:uncharacterized protein PV06_09679 [Exophiala oligosperma]|uniref:Swi5-domain-containing protein n=1 Tax=Exophiala oligosperma TaxID=215243 RepID=A0A0D2D8E7_9EURO|nr:uncharacterized protein PV06_09679 [Exophiala oligosperma]KIW38730.1 hypothetical protein PV06_09679 [Exophiala oligosperma]